MKAQLCVLSLFFLTACSGNEKPTQTETTDSAKAIVDRATQSTAVSSTHPSSENGVVTGSDTWQYSKTTDREGRSVYKASISSPTPLEFEFPYNGGSVATLTIRKRADDTHVYIQVSKGQFNRSFQEGKARVRFDGGSPATYAFSAAENGSANVIFFNSERELIKRMKAARNMLVDVEFAGQGSRQIAFNTAGLQWNY
ncbi:hypothetical protein [Spirosoma sp.]|uniref:hypothetical protein n=1 Tax=Spirosoma sp. TaxID=1899569 RepID=UPI003B3AC792